MTTFLAKIIQTKKQEIRGMQVEKLGPLRVAPSLYDTMKKRPERMQLIAEIKRASPSKGEIDLTVDFLAQAQSYERAGAAAISVLTDGPFFKGSIADLKEISQVVTLPLLCKDFILADKQLVRARNAGATIVLLIVAALSSHQLYHLYQRAIQLELEVLVEVHTAQELKQAEALGAKIIGVNNRNLATFEVDLRRSEFLGTELKREDTLYISESGIQAAADVARLAPYYQGVLVGEALMRDASPELAAQRLQVWR